MLECWNCQTEIHSTDRFCEVCGSSLILDSRTLDSRTLGCNKCGAPASRIDPEGYCGQCGLRVVPQADERVTLTLSSSLAGVSDRGLVHPHNQDAMALQSLEQGQILVVCDGVSSSYQPQLASQMAAQTICQTLEQAMLEQAIPEQVIPEQVIPDQATERAAASPALLQAAIAQAQTAVSQLALPKVQTDPSSTTVVAALVQAGVATIGWLGDSRAYWIANPATNPAVQQLTEDDSWLNDQKQSGQPLPEAGQFLPQSHAITRWLGADAVDTVPSIVVFPFPSPGYLILCSDGLWNYLKDSTHLIELISEDIQNYPADDRVITQASTHTFTHSDTQTAAQIAHQLVDYACAQGGQDNITVAVLIVHSK